MNQLHRRLATLGLMGLVFFVSGAPLAGAAEPPELSVPACKSPLYVALDLPESLQPAATCSLELVEVGRPDGSAAAQLAACVGADGSPGRSDGRLLAVIPPRADAGATRRFTLLPRKVPAGENVFQWKPTSDTSLGLYQSGRPVLVYNFGLITNEKVPAGDSRRSRACYVHPVWGLNGEVLTDDFPKDHYHHHGIFWTWPHVEIEGKEHDLWADQGIRQQFVRWLDRQAGPAAAVLGVENGWYVGEKKVMVERVWLRAYRAAEDHRVLDIDLALIPQGSPVTLRGAEGKSYGGLTMRFAPGPAKATLITVPSGPAKDDLPDTPLAWADFTSQFAGAASPSGGAIFVDPGHPDYPPTWLTRYYGPLCVGWPGVHAKTFEPGKPIRLSYRLWIHKTAVDPSQLHAAYDAYGAGKRAAW